MRTGKILTLIVGGLAALAGLAILLVWTSVNPNDYKGRIAAAVQKVTGRTLELPGDLHLSVFPWIALNLGPASLGNPPGFPAQPFLTLQHASVRVRLWPLLEKRLEFGRIDIDGLDLKLLKDATGRGNWEGFGRHAGDAPAGAAAAPDAASGATLTGIAGVRITHARVTYGDLAVDPLEIETGEFAERGVVPVTLHFTARRDAAHEAASVDAQFDVSVDDTAQRYSIAALNLNGSVNLPGHVRPEHFGAAAAVLAADLKQQTVSVPVLTVNLDSAELAGSLEATQIRDSLNVNGTVKLAPLILREWMARFGLMVPVTRDPKALTRLAADASFSYASNAARFDKLQVSLDDTHLAGNAAVNLESHALGFALTVDGIDLDRYRPPATQTPAPASAPEPEPPATASTPLEANGTLAVGAVQFAPLQLKDVRVTLASHEGVLRLYPVTADVDGGQFAGDVTLDNRGPVPVVSLDEHLKGIDVGQLLAGSKHLRLSGRGSIAIKASGHGAGADAVLKTLDGHLDTDVADGAVEGFDLGYTLARAEALLKQQSTPKVTDTHRTPFSAFKMSADITHGVLATHDLLIASPAVRITGAGRASLPTEVLDFELSAEIQKTAQSSALLIPVKVTGSFADPTVRPDVEALAKGELRQKVEDVLKEKLQGLFK